MTIQTPTAQLVGPVLVAGPRAEAVIGAIVEACPTADVRPHGSYIRIGVAGRCAVTREALCRHAGGSFKLPGDLEAIMPSFRGRLRVTDEEAEWIADRTCPAVPERGLEREPGS